ncbi:hypothetical protein D7Y46_20735 [Stenotrophomonas maltophilia]|nr:hypothetical protein [Stenotrophomonas maltophilia]MBA0317769.1 hypothetical protein [Stenotrophomonas maltophilia]
MDGFTASPQTHSAPPSHGMPAVAVAVEVAVEVAGQRPALPQVQGCKPCRTPLTPPSPLQSRRRCAPGLRSARDGHRR